MQLTHKIALCPTQEQGNYFARACGTARKVWNWALDEWNKQYAAGQKPNAMALKKQFNAVKYQLFAWLKDMHRDSHAQPFEHLARAWKRFFADIEAGARIAPDCKHLRRSVRQQGVKLAYPPTFKKKGRCLDSFYVANDKFKVDGKTIRLPKIGDVSMREALRFKGKILGATVSRTAERWFVAIQVEVPDAVFYRQRNGNAIEGVDLGIKAAATLSSGEAIEAPKPLKAALRRLKIRGRRLSRKVEAAKVKAGFVPKANLPKGTKLPASNNRNKSAATLARLHARVANVRADFTHKLTIRLCRKNQAVVIEDLNVKGMLANDKLARAISDVGFGMFRLKLEYKAERYGTRLVIADRWYPSSRLCSVCGWKNEALALRDRQWTCAQCATHHDRDLNAARNLERLATATALPVASPSGNGGAASGMVPETAGKVTPVKYECGQQDTSGQEKNRAHICALS
jgi:putative transposase